MEIPPAKPKVFVSYSHKDAELKKQFDTNLRVMERQGIIGKWTDGEIQPGDRWSESITDAMNSSQVIIFMVSNNFLDSDFIRKNEAPLALQRMNEGKAVVIPVLLRRTPGWRNEMWYTLQAIPSEVKPVESDFWKNSIEAFADVEGSLRDLIKILPAKLADQAARYKAEQDRQCGISIDTSESKESSLHMAKDMSLSEPDHQPRKGSGKFANRMMIAVATLAVAAIAVYFGYSKKIGPGSGVSDNIVNAAAIDPSLYHKDSPFQNSLGMRFVRLPETEVLCSIWELRIADFSKFAKAENYEPKNETQSYEQDPVDRKLQYGVFGKDWKNPGFYQKSDVEPVVGISLPSAKRFCDWLTKKERFEKLIPEGFEYRIIGDAEWSLAVGDSIYPWNPYEVDANKRGNYDGMSLSMDPVQKYDDGYTNTSPVGSFAPNRLGIYDLGGNVSEICDTKYDRSLNTPYILRRYPAIDSDGAGSVCCRGGGWDSNVVAVDELELAVSDLRWMYSANLGGPGQGFRIVLSPVGYSVKEDRGDGRLSIEVPQSMRAFTITNQKGGSNAFFYQVPLADPVKDFDASLQYRVLKTTENTGFGMAFKFRKGVGAPEGYRAYVNYLKHPSWGCGYTDIHNVYQANPWGKLSKGMIAVDGSPNRLRVVVRGNALNVYSNDCLVGETEFDATPLAGDLSVACQLVSFGTIWNTPNEGLDAENQAVDIEIDSLVIKK